MITSRSKRRSRRRLLWPTLIALALIPALALGLLVIRARSFDPQLPPSLTRNAAVPITLPNGRSTTIGAAVKPGLPTVVSFWASWCGPCRKEAPVMADLRKQFGGKINLLYLNVRDQEAEQADLAHFLAEGGLPAKGYARMDDRYITALTGSADRAIPHTLVFDGAGVPLASITGLKPLALARVPGLISQ